MPSSVNCGTVENTAGSLSDGITASQLPQASVICDRSSYELMSRGPAVPLVTVANQAMGSVAPLMQVTDMAEQIMPMDNARYCGSMVQICVFSTELANCAAESVSNGCYGSIVDFHRAYCAAPVSQV